MPLREPRELHSYAEAGPLPGPIRARPQTDSPRQAGRDPASSELARPPEPPEPRVSPCWPGRRVRSRAGADETIWRRILSEFAAMGQGPAAPSDDLPEDH